MCLVITASTLLVSCRRGLSEKQILSGYRPNADYGELEISYPLDSCVFPPEIPAPVFRWKDSGAETDTWLVTIIFHEGGKDFHYLSRIPEWVPDDSQWESIKRRSRETALVRILGVRHDRPKTILSEGKITFSTSPDSVGSPLFYREVNLPFIDAVKDPSLIRWRFGPISSRKPPRVVLDKLPVCGNCHSFSADGKFLGMDVDYANDKGSYALTPVAEEMVLDSTNIITWGDYKREDNELTFGLLSQVSPDGRYAVSTVKDRSVFVPTPGLDFSQLFFPVKGILVVYDLKLHTFSPLPGADENKYVQSNPTWSPDGKEIMFTRSIAYDLKTTGDNVLLTEEECQTFLKGGRTFLYDLYRVPFKKGRGAKAKPVPGASHNGMSNYFAKYSPDGKWIVFCKAKSFSLLQPDSRLYIMPAAGGEGRLMRCNTSRMNSWHSWSPNGKWLVFSSKVNGPYTQLWLTHIDEHGISTPPVVLDRMTAPDRAANIPEFVNAHPDAIKKISADFLDDNSFYRAGIEFIHSGDLKRAQGAFQKAIQLNPENVDACYNLACVFLDLGNITKAKECFLRVLELDPKHEPSLSNLGSLYTQQDSLDAALNFLTEAVQCNPRHANNYNNLALVFSKKGIPEKAIQHYETALSLDPDNIQIHDNLGTLLQERGRLDKAFKHFSRALALAPENPLLHIRLADVLTGQGNYKDAVSSYQKAVDRFTLMLDSDRDNISLRDNLGMCYMAMGKLMLKQNRSREAGELFNRASAISPRIKRELARSR